MGRSRSHSGLVCVFVWACLLLAAATGTVQGNQGVLKSTGAENETNDVWLVKSMESSDVNVARIEADEEEEEEIICPPVTITPEQEKRIPAKNLDSPKLVLAGLTANIKVLEESLDSWHRLLTFSCQDGVDLWVVSRGVMATEHGQRRFERSQKQCFPQYQCGEVAFFPDPPETKSISNRVDRISFLRDYQRQLLSTHYGEVLATGIDNFVFALADLDLHSLPSTKDIWKEAQRILDTNFDVICAAGVMHHPFGYYDIFATVLDDGTFVYPLAGRQDGEAPQPHENRDKVRDSALYANVTQEGLLRYFEEQQQNGDDPVPVRSCFGGLALYRASAWLTPECRYVSSEEEQQEHPKYLSNVFDGRPCEHVKFHACLKRHAHTRIAVQPRLRTVWDEPPAIPSFLLPDGKISYGLLDVWRGLAQSKYQAEYSPEIATQSKLVNGPYSLVIDPMSGALVVQKEQPKPNAPLQIWRSPLSSAATLDWEYAFVTLERITGTLTLSHQRSGGCPVNSMSECFQPLINATSCYPCRKAVWSYTTSSLDPEKAVVHLGRDGILRMTNLHDGMEAINTKDPKSLYYQSGIDILNELSNRNLGGKEGVPKCIPSGTERDVNLVLAQGGPFTEAILCPQAVFELQGSIVFASPYQQLYTMGHPTSQKYQAVLRIASPKVTTAVHLGGYHSSFLSHVTVDGNRPVLGPSELDYLQALILAGGAGTFGQVVRHVHAYETRSWSTLHFMEGPDDARCRSGLVEHCHLGPAGIHQDGLWADGLSIACEGTVVRNNTIIDATDVGIVVFGAPGSVVEDNTIISRTRAANGGMTLVDYDPFNGDFRGTIVRRNIVSNFYTTTVVGISMGVRTWISLPDEKELRKRLLTGATVVDNIVQGRPETVLFPFAIDGVQNWTVSGNVASIFQESDSLAPFSSYAPPFSYNQSSSFGYFQDDFKNHPELPSSAIKVLLASRSTCIPSGTDDDINGVFASAEPFVHAVLCPGAIFELSRPIQFTAPHQALYTKDKPTRDNDRRALLRIVDDSVSTAIDMLHHDHVELSHVIVDGNCPKLGQARIQVYGEGLIRAGGSSFGQQIRHVEARETRSWITIHLIEGDHLNNRCANALVENCHIADAGKHIAGSSASGLAMACPASTVRNNTIIDTTDVGIVLFGAPGSTVEHNQIIAHSRSMNAALTMVDYDPFGGNFSGTIVRENFVLAENGDAVMGMGIAMGVRTWRHVADAELATFLLRGGTVVNNFLKGHIASALTADGVADWRVTGNTVEIIATFDAPRRSFRRFDFLVNRSTSSGDFQTEFHEEQETTCSAKGLAIAWLASFPNSGTSYTLNAVRWVTNSSCATNYGAETMGEMDLVFANKGRLGSPFWISPSWVERPARGYILTKTHCGGRCIMCAPRGYILSKEKFLEACLETHIPGEASDSTFKNKVEAGSYDLATVEKIVHLIRDPLDNLVSRFHQGRKSHLNDEQRDLYPKSAQGFRDFCADMVDRHSSTVEPPVPEEIWDLLIEVPCHNDLIRYVNWHNHLFSLAKEGRISSLVVHYERYGTHWNETMSSLLNFLEQPTKNLDVLYGPANFEQGKTYHDYYNQDKVDSIRQALHFLSSEETWRHLRQYFEPKVGPLEPQTSNNPLGISMLLAFPNSGTSYTLQNVRHESNINCATNYGAETKGELVPVISEAESGPFWLPQNFERPTKGTILTKTHCGGYDILCQSSPCYRLSAYDFMQTCLETHIPIKAGSLQVRHNRMDAVKSFVHLIRDPFDNIVSRFHHERRARFMEDKKVRFGNDADGFRAFCASKVDLNRPPVVEEVWEFLQDVPCHNDFLKYIIWHNRAFQFVTKTNLPSLIVHYESYETNWNETTVSMLDFLGQKPKKGAKSHPFKGGKNYRSFYKPNEVEALQRAFQLLSTEQTWEHIKDYFRAQRVTLLPKYSYKGSCNFDGILCESDINRGTFSLVHEMETQNPAKLSEYMVPVSQDSV